MSSVAQNIPSAVSSSSTGANIQSVSIDNLNSKESSQQLSTQIYTVKHGDSVQKLQVPSFAQLVHTPTGKRIILTNHNQQSQNPGKARFHYSNHFCFH